MPIRIVRAIPRIGAPRPYVPHISTRTPEEDRFYRSRKWTRTSREHRALEPLCRECLRDGNTVLGHLTDHIVPLRQGGDPWDERNLQTLCNRCHNRKRQSERPK